MEFTDCVSVFAAGCESRTVTCRTTVCVRPGERAAATELEAGSQPALLAPVKGRTAQCPGEDPGRRRRAGRARVAPARARARGVRDRARGGRARGARAARGGVAAGRACPRRAHAGRGRPGGVPAPAPCGQPPAGADADRARRGREPRGGPRRRRRRLRHEAVRARGAPRTHPRPAPADDERRGRDASLRRPRARPGHARGAARRRARRADADRVLAPRALHAEPAPGADAVDHLRARLGLRLRLRLELARRLHRLPAAQDGGGRQAAPDPHRPRRRLRPARAVSFRARLTLVAAAAVALAVVLASVVVWLVVRNQLYRELDNRLKSRAAEITVPPGPHPERGYGGRVFLDVPGKFLGFDYVQAVYSDGSTLLTLGESRPLPVDAQARRAALGKGRPYFSGTHLGDTKMRVLTIPGLTGFALQ